MSITGYDNTNKSLNNIYVDLLNSNQRFRQRRSLDYGKNGFILAGPNRYKSLINSNHNSIPSSPSYNNSNCPLSGQFPRSQIFIRRQSSERCLIKRHSVDSNQSNISDPGYSLINNNQNCAGSNSLFPSHQRSPKDSNSPLSYHSSAVSVTGRNESYVSINILSRQNSINSSNHFGKQSNNDLESRKWFSSSSVILTRVKSMKDKFRRVVVQSVQPDDWPPPSILFSEKYKYSSCQSTSINTHTKSAQVLNRDPINLVKSKSIDQSTFPSFFNNKKLIKGNSLNNSSGRQKRGKLQRSMTSYSSTNDQLEHINNSENGIVCTDFDLKSIINNFKREEATSNSVQEKLKLNQNVSKTPTATSSVLGPGFGKRKLMRKQVSFDDEQGITVVNRKVSAIAEEIECQYGSDYDRKNSLTASKIENIDTDITKSLKFVKSCPPETTKEDENEHLTLEDSENVALLQILPKEIEFDEFGQTWEIYGADPDPEILGQAIQNHLERLMICRKSLTVGNGNANVTKTANSVNPNRVKMKIKKRIFKPLGVDLESSENHFRLLFRRLCGKWSCFSHDSQQSTSRFHNSNQKLTVSIDNES